MARVVATLKILPSDISTHLDKLRRRIEEALPGDAYIHRFEEEPIAFGLVALLAHIIIPEVGGGEMERVEKAIRGLGDVGQVEVLMVRKI